MVGAGFAKLSGRKRATKPFNRKPDGNFNPFESCVWSSLFAKLLQRVLDKAVSQTTPGLIKTANLFLYGFHDEIMVFPETRLTLIHRIAAGNDDAAWKHFLSDYWRPICLFASRIGDLRWEDAEDIASQTFEVLSRKDLLKRWLASPQARFKTLVCSVVRNLVSNWVRSDQARVRRLKEYAEEWENVTSDKARAEDVSMFFGIWADELLHSAIQSVMWQYHHEGNGDYFRVLHGRICDALAVKEIATLLGIKVTDAENYYRHAKQRLAEQLQAGIRREVERYTVGDDLAEEVRLQTAELHAYFDANGGLGEAIRRVASAGEAASDTTS